MVLVELNNVIVSQNLHFFVMLHDGPEIILLHQSVT